MFYFIYLECIEIFRVAHIFHRIQQIQLLGRDLKMQEHEMLWNQIESEIFLHRHKTVIRACKRNHKKRPTNSTEISNSSHFNNETKEAIDISLKKQPPGELRIVKFHRKKSEGLGISITVKVLLIILQFSIKYISYYLNYILLKLCTIIYYNQVNLWF